MRKQQIDYFQIIIIFYLSGSMIFISTLKEYLNSHIYPILTYEYSILIILKRIFQLKLYKLMLQRTIEEVFSKHLKRTCDICTKTIGQEDNIPFIICSNFHLSCQDCLKNITRRKEIVCQICNESKSKSELIQYTQLNNILLIQKKVKSIVEQYRQTQQILIKIVNDLFLKREFDQAVKICKEIMQTNYFCLQNFQAVGHRQQFKGYGKDQEQKFYYERLGRDKLINILDIVMLSSKFLNKESELLQFLKTLQLKFPQNELIPYQIGIMLSNKLLHKEAKTYYQKAYKINVSLPKMQRWMAFTYYQLGQLDLAKTMALKPIQHGIEYNIIDPYCSYIEIMASINKEQIFFSSSVYQRLLKIIEQNPNILAPQYFLGFELQKEGVYNQALHYYTNCIKKSPSFGEAILGAGICYLQFKQPTKVIELMGDNNCKLTCSSLNERIYKQSILVVGQAFVQLSNKQQALKCIQEVEKKWPQNVQVYLISAEAYMLSKDTEQAIKILYIGLEKVKQKHLLIKKIFQICFEIQNFERIEKLGNDYQQDASLSGQVLLNFAQYFYERKFYEKSIIFLKKLVEKKYNSSIIYVKIIDACCKIQSYEEALKYSLIYNKQYRSSIDSWQKIKDVNLLIRLKKEGDTINQPS